jgi:multicomponent Na+:H+ antiporter subunit E
MSAFTVGAVSLVVWVLLWGDASLGNIISGMVVAALLMVVFPNDGPLWPRHFFHPLAALRFGGYFLWNIVVSNVVLSREILTRHSSIRTGVVVVPMPDCSPAMITFIANVTALTPGTMAVEISNDPPELSVHVLLLYDVDEARAAVDKLRYLTVKAFGAPEIRADCVRLIEPGDAS